MLQAFFLCRQRRAAHRSGPALENCWWARLVGLVFHEAGPRYAVCGAADAV